MADGKVRLVGCLEVAAAAVVWGSNGVIVNLVPLPSYAITFFRVLFATIAISIWILASGKLTLFRPCYPVWRLFVLGGLLCLGWVLLFEAMKLLPIAEAVLLNYTAPIFVAVLAAAFLNERATRRLIASLASSFAGIILIVYPKGGFEGLNALGFAVALLAGFAYALFIIAFKGALANVASYTLALYSNLFASIILAPALATFRPLLPLSSWLMLLTLGVVNTAFAISLYLKGLEKVKAQEAAALAYLEPASAALFAFLLLGQTLPPTAAVGGFLILLGGYAVISRYARS
ncbi:TPA: DMT family transporter [Candidatus Bathyarchaeota archaeon]|nr:DMT family transporter [Candidatus Bathyarchaeota archaeon]